ncbi:MAG: Maleylacetoacetate isomerase [Herminiimonas sp.]|nr:Maleylacetoacetate isomerase [Herminiimonas sp.]MDB5853748.1 Maleylacetoacetate isomerase [Herminiimonas sp.]
MKLYSFFRSSASYRVRIALNLKGLDYDVIPVHLVKGGGEQLSESYRKLNPNALVPTFIDDAGAVLTQSLAIMEYLDEVHPEPLLLPGSALDRAHIRSLALQIACDIHPLNNLRILRYLTRDLKVSEDDKNAWYRHWCVSGLAALEATLVADSRTGTFCAGEKPTLADCCLVPQVANAQRFDCDLTGMATVMRIHTACLDLDAFARAAPANQPDAE